MKTWIAALVCVLAAATASAQASPDNSRVPPLSSVIGSANAVYTFAPGSTGASRQVLRNGVDTQGAGSEILIFKLSAYVKGDDANWYLYTGGTPWSWENIGPVDPAGGPIVPPVIVTSFSRIGWVQPNRSVVQARAGVTTIYTDGSARPLANIVCLAVNAQTECDAPLPALTSGKHALALTFRTVAGGVESGKSNVVNVTTSTSLTPIGVGLKP